jgi:hypothetical protein
MARARTVALLLGWTVGCTHAPPAASPVAGAKPAATCFGAAAEPVLDDVLGPEHFQIVDRQLYFVTASRKPQRMDVETRRISELPRHLIGDVMDARQSFWVTNINQLIAQDVATGKEIKLLDGPNIVDDLILPSSLGLYGTYIYYGHVQGPTRAQRDAGFFRIRRDGSSAEERLAPSPDADAPFVVAAGFVYWEDFHEDRPSVVRRALAAGAPMELVARLSGRDNLGPRLWVAENRVFFADAGSLWSVPVDGRAPPVEQIALGAGEIRGLLVQPPCFYWTSGTTLRRAHLDRGKGQTPVTLADERNFGGGTIATDGRFLYWGDPKTRRIVRAGPGPDVRAPVPELVATRAPDQLRRPRQPGHVVLAEGWGCASLHRERVEGWDWQCWRAPGPRGGAPGTGGPEVAAKIVPKLVAGWLVAGRTRICQTTASAPRCWSWDEMMDGAPPESTDAAARSPSNHLIIGGTFTCTGGSGAIWTCRGDNSLGQLGDGTTAPAAEGSAGSEQSGLSAVGDWHACSQGHDLDLACWGRDDVGQLGYPAKETCQAGGRGVPCSTRPRPPAFQPKRFAWLQAGDLFTCASTDRIRCWGASRDGFFGKATDCPPSLRRAWPTLNGTVAAPNAACARAPTEIPGFEGKGRRPVVSFSSGPRGLCALPEDKDGTVRCLGAIPTPRLTGVQRVQVQPGDQPAACAVAGKQHQAEIFCWGAGYSPPDDPAAPVRIAFEQITLPGKPVLDAPAPSPAGWPAVCDVHFACEFQPKPLAACAPNAKAVAWSELATRVTRMANKTVSVRGPLVVGPVNPEAAQRDLGEQVLCGRRGRWIAIGGAEVDLLVENMACYGDDSRLCCSAPAYGQPVIATGRLGERDGRWTLHEGRVCAEPVVSGRPPR